MNQLNLWDLTNFRSLTKTTHKLGHSHKLLKTSHVSYLADCTPSCSIDFDETGFKCKVLLLFLIEMVHIYTIIICCVDDLIVKSNGQIYAKSCFIDCNANCTQFLTEDIHIKYNASLLYEDDKAFGFQV